MMNDSLLGELKTKLRLYQVNAINMVQSYIHDLSATKQAMVKMPTGTGKTGVMSVIAEAFESSILILAPNAVIPKQLKEEIGGGFFKKIGYKGDFNKSVTLIDDSIDLEKLNFDKPQVIVMTIQRLLEWYKSQNNNYKILVKEIQLIMFDEGHKEPAPIWSDANRSFQCKKVLFTATPYRNDKTLFQIDENYTYNYSTQNALNEKSICSVKFEEIPFVLDRYQDIDDLTLKEDIKNQNNDNMAAFINKLVLEDKKILVRLKERENIEKLTDTINASEEIAVGFHTDSDNKGNHKKYGDEIFKVKDIRKVFIQSDMLIEGLDFKELDCLVIFDCFSNIKSFIQMIGRVLRNNVSKDEAVIYLPKDKYSYLSRQWNLYIENDSGNKKIEYINTEFRYEYAFEKDVEFYKNLLIPQRAKIYKTNISMLEELKDSINKKIESRLDLGGKGENEIVEDDYIFWFKFYEKQLPSRLLSCKYYLDKSFELTTILQIKRCVKTFEAVSKDGVDSIEEVTNEKYYIFYMDTSNFSIPSTPHSGELKLLGNEDIFKLLPNDADIRNARFTLTTPMNFGMQTRDISGFNLNKLPGDTTERLSYCRNVTSVIKSNKKNIQRYVSPTRAKISDLKYCEYNEYIQWSKAILDIIETNKKGHDYFNRYSKLVSPPLTSPTSIIVEMDTNIIELEDRKVLNEFFQESIYMLVNNNVFELELNGRKIECEICNKATGDILINVKECGVYDYCIEDTEEGLITLEQYLNKKNFRLYYNEIQVMYCDGYFFKPNIRTYFHNASEWQLYQNIISLKGLNDLDDEKTGDKIFVDKNWPKRSVFNVVVDYLRDIDSIDYVVCDDMQKEMADFVALSSDYQTCYFIHCKHDDTKISASTFEEVCGQAIKNMQYIITNYNDLGYMETHIKLYSEDWENDKLPFKISRVVKYPEAFEKLPKKDIIEKYIERFKAIMNSDTSKKEVWLVHSGLSKKKLEEELIKDGVTKKQVEQIPHLFWILQNTQDTFKQVGADLKIFCKE